MKSKQGIKSFMTRIRILQAGLMLSVLLCAVKLEATPAAAEEKKHSDPSKSCVSKDCHPEIVKHKYKHGPVVLGQCTVCHAPLPGDQHKFRVEPSETKLCATCHKPVDTEPNLHDPVAKGQCLKCHDPHGSEEPHQVRLSPQVKLCNDCHKPVLTRKYAHKPVADGECLSCHRSHGSKAKKLLDASGSKLCLQQCHEKMRPVIVRGKEQKAHLASEDCTKCHRSHDSSYPSLLTRSPAEMCLDGCHKEIKENMASSEFKHDPMTKGLACVECHRAHDNRFGRLLSKPATDQCLTCHDKFQNQLETAKFKHRPAADRSCLSCHVPHDSSYNKLLFADYPSDTSSAYDPAKYAFCFSCHSEKVVRERYTTRDTDFRNGRLNLHYLHVNREKGGQTCRACHGEHAGNQPKLIRDKMQFGNWEVSIRINKSNTGGSCLTGCHREYAYDRVNPVQLSAQ
jgi:predicted CXXCH cytochrome family protein